MRRPQTIGRIMLIAHAVTPKFTPNSCNHTCNELILQVQAMRGGGDVGVLGCTGGRLRAAATRAWQVRQVGAVHAHAPAPLAGISLG